LELKSLEAFVAVADASGFRRAATHTHVRQSVLSRRVRELEEELGVSLFERHRAGVRLTHAGQRFRESVRVVIDQLENAVSAVRAAGRAGTGRLRIGVTASLSSGFLRRLLAGWLEQHPEVALDFVETAPRENMAGVLDRRLDVTFLSGDAFPPGCDHERLWYERVMAVVPAGHRLAARSESHVQELAGERFILTEGGGGKEIRDYVIRFASDLGTSPRIEFFAVGREALMSLIGLGLGVTLVSTAEVGASYPDVVLIPMSGDPVPFSAVWSPDNDNPALRRFLSEARLQAKREGSAAEPLRKHDQSP
jgi:DNA-binding transcriptional LysR family regulator